MRPSGPCSDGWLNEARSVGALLRRVGERSPQFIALLDNPEFNRFDLRTLRTGIMAGLPCPVEVIRRVVDRMHMREVAMAYGLTETSPVSFQSAHDDPLERRVSTVGRIQPHIGVKIVDRHGRIVPPGVPGELLTRGYSVMRDYWDVEAATVAAIDEVRFMHSGDLAVIDVEGYCNIVVRLKDMIIRGGENIYPREIEKFSIPTRRSPTCRPSASPITAMERNSACGSGSAMALVSLKTTSSHSVAPRSFAERRGVTYVSSTRFQ